MTEILAFSKAKTGFSSVYDDVEQAGLRLIGRRKSEPIALVRRSELADLYAREHPFTTQMSRSGKQVSIWLNEFDVYGQGPSITAAVEALISEVEEYVAHWEAELRHAPNHVQRSGWVRRIQLAGGDRADIRRVIFPQPTDHSPR